MSHFRVRIALAAALLILPGLVRAAADVTVVVDLSPEGRKVAHPTPDHPSYYKPTMGTYQEMGGLVAGEKPPSVHAMVHVVATELAKQGYLVALSHPPDLVIDISWGTINLAGQGSMSANGNIGIGLSAQGTGNIGTNVDSLGLPAPTGPLISGDDIHAQNQMLALVLGHTVTNVMSPESAGHSELLEAANDDRYFVVVTAYDFSAWESQHRRVVLWKAKMSVPKEGYFFDDILDSLVKAGGPSFGRETINHPRLEPLVPNGHVEIGTPTVKNDTQLPAGR